MGNRTFRGSVRCKTRWHRPWSGVLPPKGLWPLLIIMKGRVSDCRLKDEMNIVSGLFLRRLNHWNTYEGYREDSTPRYKYYWENSWCPFSPCGHGSFVQNERNWMELMPLYLLEKRGNDSTGYGLPFHNGVLNCIDMRFVYTHSN